MTSNCDGRKQTRASRVKIMNDARELQSSRGKYIEQIDEISLPFHRTISFPQMLYPADPTRSPIYECVLVVE